MKTYIYNITKNDLQKQIDNQDFQDINSAKSVLVQIFSGEGIDKIKKDLAEIKKLLPNAVIIGSSTDGEIIKGNVTTFNSIVSISTFEATTLKVMYTDLKDAFNNGVTLAKSLVTKKTKLLISFIDGLLCNGEEFVNGINSIAPNLIIAGGLAGDNATFEGCQLICDDTVYTRGTVAVTLDSDVLQVNTKYSFGWEKIGIVHTITSSKANRIYTIDNIRAIDFYTRYLGSEMSDNILSTGIEFPLIFQKDNIAIARAITYKHSDGSLSFAGNISEGQKVYLGFGEANQILSKDIEGLNNIPIETSFIYSCMARRRFMPNLIYKELEPFNRVAPTVGFFTYGEFYTAKKPQLLNQTLTSVSLSESKEIKKIPKQEKIVISAKEKSLKALTHLITQISKEYEEVNKNLHKEIVSQKTSIELINDMFTMLLDTMSEGAVICNEEYSIIDTNLAIVNLLGYSEEEMIGRSIKFFLINETRSCDELQAIPQNVEVTFAKKSGNKLEALLTSTSILQADRTFYIVTIIDLTEIKAKNMQLLQQSKLAQMGEMINMIAHQWRQPLNAISAASIKLNMQSDLDILTHTEVEKTTLFIQDMTQKMSKTIDDFMNFTKPNHKIELVELNEIFKEIMGIIQTQLIAHGIVLEINNPNNIAIATQKVELSHVLINIIINARDALDELEQKNKKIKIDVNKEENIYRIDISDNANGISKKNLKRLFEPYFTTKEQGKGTGLGLYMSKKILREVLYGDISAKNSTEGAVFTITLKDIKL